MSVGTDISDSHVKNMSKRPVNRPHNSVTNVCRQLCVAILKLFPGNEATLNFYLSNFTDIPSLVTAVRNIAYIGGNTNTTGGLRLMRTEVFNPSNGDRPRIPNVAILITDGIPTREVAELPAEVQRNKNRGTRIVGVGVTNAVSERTINSRFSILPP